ALIEDIRIHAPSVHGRKIQSIFLGGGTPSLLSPRSVDRILNACAQYLALSDQIEITLEANPGRAEQQRFRGFLDAGVNRLSIGIQSFNDASLHALGRVHSSEEAHQAVMAARAAGCDNLNLDMMFGLPQQTVTQAMQDLDKLIAHRPDHISYYQLTIEPNTRFFKHPPKLTEPDTCFDLHEAAMEKLDKHGYQRYEVSAFSQTNKQCLHNLNYWLFGDYLGIGAGAHGKLTDSKTGLVTRSHAKKLPASYMKADRDCNEHLIVDKPLNEQDRVFEFMLNALRLTQGFPVELFEDRAQVAWSFAEPTVEKGIALGWLCYAHERLCPTSLGYRHLNDTISLFLPE
ncbi:radical SAM family heme chaperone HemW, partial [Nitrosomonas sp.]|uniref:radical SAM family heme chaperone HemW n=1 Tax=Nitrosomonas sp. TaxID=42353 RepID=UPI001DCCAAC6